MGGQDLFRDYTLLHNLCNQPRRFLSLLGDLAVGDERSLAQVISQEAAENAAGKGCDGAASPREGSSSDADGAEEIPRPRAKRQMRPGRFLAASLFLLGISCQRELAALSLY